MLQEARYVVRVNALPKLCHFFLDGSADRVQLHGEEMLVIRAATDFSRHKRHSTGFLMGSVICCAKFVDQEKPQVSDRADHLSGLGVRLSARRYGLCNMIIGVSNGEMFTTGRVEKEFPALGPLSTSAQAALGGNCLFSGGHAFCFVIIRYR